MNDEFENTELELIDEDTDVEELDDSIGEFIDDDEEDDEISPLLFYGAVAGGALATGGIAYLIYRIIHGDRIRFRSPVYLESSEENYEDDENEEEDEGSEETETNVKNGTSKKRARKKKRRR